MDDVSQMPTTHCQQFSACASLLVSSMTSSRQGGVAASPCQTERETSWSAELHPQLQSPASSTSSLFNVSVNVFTVKHPSSWSRISEYKTPKTNK